MGSQGQCKIEPVDFIFLHFSTEWDQIWCCDEAFQAEYLDITFEYDFGNEGK